jgi:hypothetical protein
VEDQDEDRNNMLGEICKRGEEKRSNSGGKAVGRQRLINRLLDDPHKKEKQIYKKS